MKWYLHFLGLPWTWNVTIATLVKQGKRRLAGLRGGGNGTPCASCCHYGHLLWPRESEALACNSYWHCVFGIADAVWLKLPGWHCLFDIADAVWLKLPGWHCVFDIADTVWLKLPGWHWVFGIVDTAYSSNRLAGWLSVLGIAETVWLNCLADNACLALLTMYCWLVLNFHIMWLFNK